MNTNPMTLTAPASRPIPKAPVGDTMLQVEPIATPPANAAFAISTIEVLPLWKYVLKKYVVIVAPHSARTVLTTVCGICSKGTMAVAKLGQKSHRTIEPSIANRSEVASDSIGWLRCRAVVRARDNPRPKYAPKACMMIDPAVS